MKAIIIASIISALLVIPHSEYWVERLVSHKISIAFEDKHCTASREVADEYEPHSSPSDAMDDSFPDWFVEFIKQKEGFEPRKYYCCGGKLTIGYGFTEKSILSRFSVMTQIEADKVLREEILPKYRDQVRSVVSVRLTKRQELALTSFCMNLGVGRLKTLVNGSERLNGGNYASIRKIMPLYRKAGGKIRQGLVKRRAFEVDLFYSKDVDMLASL